MTRARVSLAAAALSVIAFAPLAVAAQSRPPSPAEFLGYEVGTRFTPPERIVAYFEALAARSANVGVQRIGTTYEGRPLIHVVITSARNHATLDEIRARVAGLRSDVNVRETEARTVAATTPAIALLQFGVHGNETASSEAAMLIAHALLTGTDAARLLDQLVVVIDPVQNPDGRARYVSWFERTHGMRLDPSPDAFEHWEPWPSGRFNHYLVDMNRDWTWQSQVETRARTTAYRRWYPQVVVDFHEMGFRRHYFFPPVADPINRNLPAEFQRWMEVFGRSNADAFTARGWPFFVSENYDFFYPAYGDVWPAFHGAIGMTYEVGGSGRAGLVVDRDDGTRLTLANRIERHYTTGMSTLRTAAANREGLLLYTYNLARAQARSRRTFVVVPGSPNFRPLVDMLVRNGIRVETLSAPLRARATRIGGTADSRTFAAGSAVVSTQQPLGALAATLLERSAEISRDVMAAQRANIEADERDEFYDLTAWSLPLAMNVEAYEIAGDPQRSTRPWVADAPAPHRASSYGYLVDGSDPNVYALVGHLLRADVRFSVAEREISTGARRFGRGTVIVLRGGNTAALDSVLAEAVRTTGAAVFPLESGWTSGTALGSPRVRAVRRPRIALLAGPATMATSFGALWYTLDVHTPIPHTVVSVDNFRSIELRQYDVLIFPDGDYTPRFGRRAVEQLQSWTRAGGTIVAVKGASAFLRERDVGLSKLRPWQPPRRSGDTTTAADSSRHNEFSIPGAAFRTRMQERSYLTFGVPAAPTVLIEGFRSYFQPVTHTVDNIVTVDARDPLVSGVAWRESLDRLKGSPYLVREEYGSGAVITFADEPHARLFWRGTLPLFLNAVLYSPTFLRAD